VSGPGAMLDSLPAPYAWARTSILAELLDILSLELEIGQEDVHRMRLTHWVEQAYTLGDVARLAALVGSAPLPWESVATFRARLVPLVRTRLRGSLAPGDIRQFVFEYLQAAQEALARTAERLSAHLVPGLERMDGPDAAFATTGERPLVQPLALVENPTRRRRSVGLAETGGRVRYLARWRDRNLGFADASPRFTVLGASSGRTSVPIIINRTTGRWIGYRGVVDVGRKLVIRREPGGDRAVARLDSADVTDRLMSGNGFRADRPFAEGDLDATPTVPLHVRGDNHWGYLSGGLLGVRGVDHSFFAVASDDLEEAVFDASTFDHAIFPGDHVATIEMEWSEREPASFEVRVPHGVVVEPAPTRSITRSVFGALEATIAQLRAAGVQAALVLEPFAEIQGHRSQVRLPWVSLPVESGPTGDEAGFMLGARFGEAAFGGTRFE
jgi:hypothetical protein